MFSDEELNALPAEAREKIRKLQSGPGGGSPPPPDQPQEDEADHPDPHPPDNPDEPIGLAGHFFTTCPFGRLGARLGRLEPDPMP